MHFRIEYEQLSKTMSTINFACGYIITIKSDERNEELVYKPKQNEQKAYHLRKANINNAFEGYMKGCCVWN